MTALEPANPPVYIIALDLSLTATGYASYLDGKVATGRRTGGTLRGAERLSVLTRRIMDLICCPPCAALPALILIEDGVVRSSAAKALGELHGCVKRDLFDEKLTPTLIAPASVKKYATGKGNAGKPEMLACAMKRLGYEGYDEDEVDALWMLAMGMDHLGHPLAGLPVSHRVALEAVDWKTATG